MRCVRTKILWIVCLALLVNVILISIGFAQDHHVWLHVEGRYIKKSPYCTDPNGIWMGCGIAHRNQDRSLAVQEQLAQWVQDNNANLIRLGINNSTGLVDITAFARIGSVAHPYTWFLKNDKDYKMPADQWYHVVVTHDSQCPRLYINGKLQSYTEKGPKTDFSTWMSKHPHAKIAIARIPGQQEGPFEGEIDEITIYNRPLSEDEIKTRYENNRGGFRNEE